MDKWERLEKVAEKAQGLLGGGFSVVIAPKDLEDLLAEHKALKAKLDICIRYTQGEVNDPALLANDYGGLGYEQDPVCQAVAQVGAERDALKEQMREVAGLLLDNDRSGIKQWAEGLILGYASEEWSVRTVVTDQQKEIETLKTELESVRRAFEQHKDNWLSWQAKRKGLEDAAAELDRIKSLEPVGWQGQETFHFFPDTVSPTAWRTLRDDELDLWRSKVAELPHRYVIRPIYTLEKP